MIKYTIAVSSTADKDGDFVLAFQVHSQDESLTAKMFDLEFEASNGWKVRSSKFVVVDVDNKEVYILGQFGTSVVSYGSPSRPKLCDFSVLAFKTREEALKVKNEIKVAIAELVAAGKFAENEKFDIETVEL